mmetsp:Transcript_10239/g.26245  ORF Transcript_10239/g.26245 Transcript_10239/m.26245 type:complete len:454 (+) Transcript_10239:387-1748(+)
MGRLAPPATSPRPYMPIPASSLREEPEDAGLDAPLLSSRLDAEDVEASYASGSATVLHSVFNVVNLFMGVGLLSLPYATKLGGWMALPALVLASALFCFSGHLIVSSFRKVTGPSHSYSALGERAYGRMGRRLVNICTLCDMFGGCAICLIMSCKQIEGLILPRTSVWGLTPSQLARVIGITAALPTVLIRSFRQIASVSMLGICCSFMVVLAVIMSAVLDPSRQHTISPSTQEFPTHHSVSPSLPRSIGIFALSMAGHSALPSFRNSMKRPQMFHLVINVAFAVMTSFNLLVTGIGYWYWGDEVSEIVMQDIALKSPLRGVLGIDVGMTALIGLNAFSKVPTLLLVLEDLVTASFFADAEYSEQRGMLIKCGMVTGIAIVSASAYNVLGLVMSLLGGMVSMNASVVFPHLFYLKLYWAEISILRRVGVGALLVFSVCLSCLIVVENARGLIQ